MTRIMTPRYGLQVGGDVKNHLIHNQTCEMCWDVLSSWSYVVAASKKRDRSEVQSHIGYEIDHSSAKTYRGVAYYIEGPLHGPWPGRFERNPLLCRNMPPLKYIQAIAPPSASTS